MGKLSAEEWVVATSYHGIEALEHVKRSIIGVSYRLYQDLDAIWTNWSIAQQPEERVYFSG